MMTEGQAKGTVIRGLLRDIKNTHPPGIADVLRRLSDETRSYFEKPILHGRWYPYRVFTALLETMFEHIGRGKPDYLIEVGRRAVDQDLSSFFKLVLTIVSPRILGERSRTFWQQKFRPGSFRVTDIEDTGYVLVLEGFPMIHPAHCLMIEGYIQALGEHWRKDLETVHIECVHHRGQVCAWRCRWSGERL